MKSALCLLVALLGQDAKPHPGVDQARADKAIDQGAEFLLKQTYAPFAFGDHGPLRYDDMVLYTLFHAGTDPKHEVFQKLLENLLKTPLERTYCVSFQAMFLSEFDPAKYQWRLKQCAQFLVDNQCRSGQWSYGVEVKQDPLDTPTGGNRPERPDVATSGGSATATSRPRTRPGRPVQVRRRGKATLESGDNSNSQYAALGLRACLEANVIVPVETLKDAREWWERSQNDDGGWGYGDKDSNSYGSMSMGALSSLVICKHHLRENWKADRRVANGLQWMVRNWTVKSNAARKNDPATWHYYFLYALERSGIVIGTEQIGTHDWYREGANFLLDAQVADGSWSEGNTWGGAIKDTCYAILFLRRATKPLTPPADVETGR